MNIFVFLVKLVSAAKVGESNVVMCFINVLFT